MPEQSVAEAIMAQRRLEQERLHPRLSTTHLTIGGGDKTGRVCFMPGGSSIDAAWQMAQLDPGREISSSPLRGLKK